MLTLTPRGSKLRRAYGYLIGSPANFWRALHCTHIRYFSAAIDG